jgi:hypothetical protein
VTLPVGVSSFQNLKLFNSPSIVGTFGLLYEKYGFNASAFLSHQSRQLDSFERAFPNEFEEPFTSLDLRMEYRFSINTNQTASVFFIATDGNCQIKICSDKVCHLAWWNVHLISLF